MGATSTICWALLLSLVAIGQAEPHYVIYAPDIVMPGKPFNVSVTLLGDANTQSFVRAMIRNSSNRTEVEVSGTMDSYSTAVFYMYIPDYLVPDQYYLFVTSDGYAHFDASIGLTYHVRSVSTFIQTDKPIYKPGEMVHIRVLSLNENGKPVHSAMNVSIYDSKENLLAQWRNEISASGVVSKYFELSDQPLLGEWQIKVSHKTEKSVRTFLVEEYVLPRFEVTTVVVPFLSNYNMGMVHLLQKSIQIKVVSKYTHGKPVRGVATVEISDGNVWSSFPSKKITKSKEIYGEAVFDIMIKELITPPNNTFVDINQNMNRRRILDSVSFNASVTENLTEKTLFAPIASTAIVPAIVEIGFNENNNNFRDHFKDGLTLRIPFFIKRRDGKPLQPDDYSIPLEVSIKTNNQVYQETTYEIPKNGKIMIVFDPPKNSSSVSIDVTYYAVENGVKYKLSSNRYLRPFETSFGEQMQITLLSKNITVGNQVKFQVESTQKMSRLVYTIFTKGMLLSSFQLDAKNQRNITIGFIANYTMCPKARIVVSFVTQQNELLVDSLHFDVYGMFKNSVSVKYDAPVKAPGEEVSLKMTALTGSYVFIGAVDKSVLLLESPNDITYELVTSFIDRYTNTYPLGYWSLRSSGSLLERVGLVYITNLEVKSGPQFPSIRPIDFNRRFKLFDNVEEDAGILESTAFGSPPPSAVPSAAPKVRNFFPETWIWQDAQIGSKGYEVINRVVPGTITSYVTTAFSVHPTEGLAIMRDPVEFKAFQEFYLSLDLPYSVIRNEKFKLQISIFNYMNTTEQVQVILEDSKYYKVFDDDKELVSNFTKFIQVKNNTNAGVHFWLLANETGSISIKVQALAEHASDAVQRNLLVKAEGYTVYFNNPFLVNITPDQPFVKTFYIPIHDNIVNNSARFEVSVIGDIMGPSLNGLGNLVRLPFGCGEQNMINFAPNIYIYGYLENSQLLTKATKANIIRFTTRGYENELKFRHDDGSYSAFGNRDVNGSTWLTAFVVKSFAQARKMMPTVPIEEKSIVMSLEWLMKQQLPSGRYKESGKLIHQDMQGGATKDIPLNAYILITLLETKEYNSKQYQQAVDALTKNLKEWIDSDEEKDSYSLGILLYAMSLLGDDKYFQILEAKIQHQSTKEGDRQYWKLKNNHDNFQSSIDEQGNIEIASYVLLAFTEKGMLKEAIPIMKWLLTQRNSLGGYSSTQDTVMSLQALAAMALSQRSSSEMKIDVTAFNSRGYSYTFPTITRDISTMLISHAFPSNTRNITLSARGNGTALLQVAWQYNLNSSHVKRHLRLKIMDNSTDKDRMAIEACASWKGQQKSGMVLLQIGIPSGFVPETENLDEYDLIQKAVFEGQNLVVYVEELTEEEFCFNVFANRNYLVLENQPQPIRIVLYYKPEEELVNFYTLDTLKSLNVHSWDRVDSVRRSGSNSMTMSLSQLFLVVLVAGFPLLI